MRNEEEDVHEESEESDEESRDREDQQREEVAWRMARTVKVGGHRETEADQGEKSGDRVNDKDRGETVSRRRRERKVRLCIWAGEQAIFRARKSALGRKALQHSIYITNLCCTQSALPYTVHHHCTTPALQNYSPESDPAVFLARRVWKSC